MSKQIQPSGPPAEQPQSMAISLSLRKIRASLQSGTLLGFIIMDRPVSPGAGIIRHEEGIDLLPANIELSGLEVTLVNTMSRETILREYLNSIRDEYDVILLDCCPSLGMLTINALAAADDVLVPMQAHYLSLICYT